MLSTAGLARVSARRPWFVVALWCVLLVLAGFAAAGLGDAFSVESNFTDKPESVRGDDLLTERLRGGEERPVTETVLVRAENLTVADPAFRLVVEQTAA